MHIFIALSLQGSKTSELESAWPCINDGFICCCLLILEGYQNLAHGVQAYCLSKVCTQFLPQKSCVLYYINSLVSANESINKLSCLLCDTVQRVFYARILITRMG